MNTVQLDYDTASKSVQAIQKAWIVDDDDIFRFIMRKHISTEGLAHDVEMFVNGQEAIQGIKSALSNPELLPDVIFLDINMPVMSGWEFMQEFNCLYEKLPKTVSIFMVSSSVDARDVEKAHRMNTIKEYIVKPLDKQKMHELKTRYATGS